MLLSWTIAFRWCLNEKLIKFWNIEHPCRNVKIKGCTCSHRQVEFFMKEVGIECFHIFAAEYPTWDGQNISAIKMRKLGTCKTFPRLLVATSKNLIKIYNTLFPYRDDSRFYYTYWKFYWQNMNSIKMYKL